MGVEKSVYSFRLEEEIVQKIKSYAKEENRNFSNMVETILKNYIVEREKET